MVTRLCSERLAMDNHVETIDLKSIQLSESEPESTQQIAPSTTVITVPTLNNGGSGWNSLGDVELNSVLVGKDKDCPIDSNLESVRGLGDNNRRISGQCNGLPGAWPVNRGGSMVRRGYDVVPQCFDCDRRDSALHNNRHPFHQVFKLLQWMGFHPFPIIVMEDSSAGRSIEGVSSSPGSAHSAPLHNSAKHYSQSLYPIVLSRILRVFQCKRMPKPVISISLKLLTLMIIGTNFGFFSLNVYVTHFFRGMFGMLHPYTMTSVITGLLPLQNAVNMILFWIGLRDHVKLMREVSNAFKLSRDPGHCKSWMRRTQKKLFFAFFLATIIPLIARLIQCMLLPDLFKEWHGPVSLFIVPLLRGWQMTPLLYFWLLCSTLVMRFRRLRRRLFRDPMLEEYSLECHFDQFRCLINVSQRLANFLSPFIFVSLIFAVLSLCLTVYFITHAKELIDIEPGMTLKNVINRYFDFGWGVLQVILAIAYAISICKFGWTVNEEARSVIKTVLCCRPKTEEDRFQVLRFQQIFFSQMTWGISVWKAFLIERSFLFTLTSTIVAYALVLLRLKAAHTAGLTGMANITAS